MAVQKLREARELSNNGAYGPESRNGHRGIQCGPDFIMLDLEHGPYTMETVEDVFKVGRLLGLAVSFVCGARQGIRFPLAGLRGYRRYVPMLETVEQAQLLVRWAKYPPLADAALATPAATPISLGLPSRPSRPSWPRPIWRP